MTAILATAALGSSGGYANACVTLDLRSYGAFIGWPPAPPIDVGTAPAATMTHVIAAAHPLAINGSAGRSYADDFYDRVHVTPTLLELGNLLQTQTRLVHVWNAWRDRSLTLNSVDATNAEGIVITGEGALPLAFNPLQERTWTLALSTDGPAGIDAQVTWLFADGQTGHVAITGQRLTAWFAMPDWANGIHETLAWSTDIQQGWHGAQDRTPLRGAPRRTWEFDLALAGIDRQRAETLLFAWRARAWALPIWADQAHITAALAPGATSIALTTANLDFSVGGTVLLRQSDAVFELIEIAAIAPDSLTLARGTLQAWPAGSRIYPCRVARLAETPKLTRKSSNVLTSTLRFDAAEECDWPAVSPTATYLGFPVLEDRIEESDDPTADFDRVLNTLDNDVGLPDVNDRTGLGWPTQSHAWTLAGRDARAAHRSLLYWLQGRAQALWVPTWADDLTLAASVASNATTLRVATIGAALYLSRAAGRRHLRIELAGGTVVYRAVTAASDLGDGTEQLALDAPLGVGVDPGQVRQISWLQLMTLASDSVEIDHLTDSHGVARCAVNFAGVPAEEPA